MQQKRVMRDIQRWGGEILDIRSVFPLTRTHAMKQGRYITTLDDIQKVASLTKVDLSVKPVLSIDKFDTLATLDITHSDIIRATALTRKIQKLPERKEIIDLVPPLALPYGAIDIRIYTPPKSEKKYADLYTRKLPYGLFIKRWTHIARKWSKKNRRGIMGVVVTVFVMTVPVLWYVRYSVERAYNSLSTLGSMLTLEERKHIVFEAKRDFEKSRALFTPFSWIPLSQVELADAAIEWGFHMTSAMDIFLSILPDTPIQTGSLVTSSTNDSITPEYRASAQDIDTLAFLGIDTPTDWFESHTADFQSIYTHLEDATTAYSLVHTENDIGKKVQKVATLMQKFTTYTDFILKNQTAVLKMLGHDEPVRYMIFNQNRDEIRANGGFPGSIIALTLYKGNILDMRKDDIYYYDWNLYPYKEPPPPGLALLSNSYGLRDVNYYPDFRDTLAKANDFVERSGDSTITTGIAIHQWIIEDILDTTWPVTVSGVTIPFDAKNFSVLMSLLVENQYAREHHPKDILFQFAKALLVKISDTHSYAGVLSILEKEWKDGEIVMASRDTDMDSFIAWYRKKLPWECHENTETVSSEKEVSKNNCSPNWAYPVFTSVSWNKSDRYISRLYEAKTTKIQGCTYENLITLSNTHTYKKIDTDTLRGYMDTFGIKNKEERQKLEFIEWNGKNRAFVRLYTPLGSRLAYSGSDITTVDNEHATVFSFSLDTMVASTSAKTLRYVTTIPHCESSDTNIAWTKQPWVREVEMKSE